MKRNSRNPVPVIAKVRQFISFKVPAFMFADV